METIISNRKQIFEYPTKDISAAGVFIHTTDHFPEGTRFRIDLTASSERIKELTGFKSLIECEGSVVRSTQKGIGIRFEKDCQILSLKC